MYDKRVARGNTWALRRLAKENLEIEEKEERKRQQQRRNSVRKRFAQSKYGGFQLSQLTKLPPSNVREDEITSKDLDVENREELGLNTSLSRVNEDMLDNDRGDEEMEENEIDGQGPIDNEQEVAEETDKNPQSPTDADSIRFEDFQCQVDIKAKCFDEEVQWDGQYLMDDDPKDAQVKLALRFFVDSTLLDARRELDKETEIDKLRFEQDFVLNLREADIERLQQLAEEAKSASVEKELLTTRCDELEKDKEKLITQRLAVEVIQNLVDQSIARLTINGLFLPSKYETLLQNDTLITTALTTTNLDQTFGIDNAMLPSYVDGSAEQLQTAIAADFLPWLYGCVWRSGSQKMMSKLLDDAIKCRASYCRNNAKQFLQSVLENFDETV